ncbi:MAG: hypothetical protein QNJ09_15930, partial [Paracoccaceae bacterium]|nr:hypothetical protein [Paracoccaceae bacterium]
MNSLLGRAFGTAALVCALGATGAAAQDASTNRVDAMTDWSVFEGDNPKECWAVTTYKESVNTKDGRVVSVNRGEILLMVFFRPGENVTNQVAF